MGAKEIIIRTIIIYIRRLLSTLLDKKSSCRFNSFLPLQNQYLSLIKLSILITLLTILCRYLSSGQLSSFLSFTENPVNRAKSMVIRLVIFS